MAYQLKTRPPTGRVPWPLILVEGGEKSGKSWACAELSASPRVGRTFWVDLGEGAGDEYGAIPGARYEVVEHDGSWASIYGSVVAIRDEAARAAKAGEPPTVLVIDSITAEWDLLKDWAANRARQRLAKKGKRLAADEEPQISMDLWNDANGRHRKLMTALMTFPGIAVLTARGKEVAALDSAGRPVEGSKEYKVDGQKSLAFDASAWVRMSRDQPPLIVGARSVRAGVRPGVDKPRPAPNFTLDWMIFDVLKCDPTQAHVRALVEAQPGAEDPEPAAEPARERPAAPEPTAVRDWVLVAQRTAQELRDGLVRLREHHGLLDTVVVNEHGDDEPLKTLIQRRIHDQAPAPDVEPAPAEPEPDEPMVAQEQHRHMHALWRELGYDGDANRDQRLTITARLVGRELASSKELTKAEADVVIEALKAKKRERVGADA